MIAAPLPVMPDRYVTLVYGPPCGGKSTYVYRNARQGDLILDVDALAREAGSPVKHLHADRHFREATIRFWELVDEVAGDPNAHAWIIRCAPTLWERRELAERAQATHVVLCAPPLRDVLRYRSQAARDPATVRLVHEWYRRHEPGPV